MEAKKKKIGKFPDTRKFYISVSSGGLHWLSSDVNSEVV